VKDKTGGGGGVRPMAEGGKGGGGCGENYAFRICSGRKKRGKTGFVGNGVTLEGEGRASNSNDRQGKYRLEGTNTT